MAKSNLEVLRDEPGARVCMLGNLAIVRGALEAGIQFVSCYPGTPASEIGDTFALIHEDSDVIFEYSVNEKIAVEIAFAASLTGARSLCSMKHLGLNYAGDPISTMPYIGVKGGMVIVSAGDPSALTSPNEQDQRHFSSFLYYPIFDPATPEEALRMTRYAFDFSESTRLPVILRPTTRVCHTSATLELGTLPQTRNVISYEKSPAEHVPIPVNARRMRVELSERYRQAEQLLGESEFFPQSGSGSQGIVASGVAYTYVEHALHDMDIGDRVSLYKIGAYPIPEDRTVEFLRSVESLLIVEELTPYVENTLCAMAQRNGLTLPILGKHSGHFPVEFEYNPDMVRAAIGRYLGLEESDTTRFVDAPPLPVRPPVLCPGCPHRDSFLHGKRAFGKKTTYVNDIGCYTLGYGEPLDSCDVVLCMGSSISQASGISRTTGKRTVAYIGDSTFFHSGLPALANAVQADDEITVVILNNYVTAMTGFQPSSAVELCETSNDYSPGSGGDTNEDFGLAIERAVRGLGVKQVFPVDPTDHSAAKEAFKRAKLVKGISVVICNAPCAVTAARDKSLALRAPYEIDLDKCDQCSLCVRVLGCPAISIVEGEYSIDRNLCTGCDLCAWICQRDAINQGVVDDR
jgi:indolepyruvate ferredoxin oxidoreductase, alpha subunit